jgi:nucleoid-associated protein YgaU
MQQDWLTSSLKFVRLNIGLLVVLLGFLAVVIWGGYRFARSFQAAVSTPTPIFSPETQVSDAATSSAALLATPSAVPTIKPIALATPSPTPTPLATPLAIATPKPQFQPVATASPAARVAPNAPKQLQQPTAPQVKPAAPASPTAQIAPTAPPKPSLVPTPMQIKPTPAPQQAAPQVTGTQKYTVLPGDSTWKVAEKMLGDGRLYPAIEKASGLKHNQRLAIGQELTIPDQKTVTNLPDRSKITSGVSITTDNSTAVQSSGKTYEVKPGDCLWTIAQRELGNPFAWVKLYQLNKQTVGSNPDLIYPGTVLNLPQQ